MIDIDRLKTTVAALISLISVSFGQWITDIGMMLPGGFCQDTFDRVLQELAWIIAILAGTISVVNGIVSWFKKRKNKH